MDGYEVLAPAGHVVTGIKFRNKENRFALALHVTPFDQHRVSCDSAKGFWVQANQWDEEPSKRWEKGNGSSRVNSGGCDTRSFITGSCLHKEDGELRLKLLPVQLINARPSDDKAGKADGLPPCQLFHSVPRAHTFSDRWHH